MNQNDLMFKEPVANSRRTGQD